MSAWADCLETHARAATMSTSEKTFVFVLRLLMAWTFLYAASHQVFDPGWSVVGFLKSTKTFHDLFAVFTTPSLAPVVTLLVEYGHLLIGLSLLVGLMVRVSTVFGMLLMLIYWMAHMDFPYIENHNNFIVDYHIVYAVILIYLFVKNAGRVWGLDQVVAKSSVVADNAALRPMFG